MKERDDRGSDKSRAQDEVHRVYSRAFKSDVFRCCRRAGVTLRVLRPGSQDLSLGKKPIVQPARGTREIG